MLSYETVQTNAQPDATVIWLHGLGADGHDFVPIVPQLGLDDLAIRFIFPHAPERPVTLNAGMVMPAWFDLHDIAVTGKHDEAGIREAYQSVVALIEAEQAQGIALNRIILAGFSQGGALALATGLMLPQAVAGVLALSTFLPVTSSLHNELVAQQQLPIFLAHGTQDPIVSLAAAEKTKGLLTQLGHTLDWHTYPMAHQLCPQEIHDISAWIRARLVA